MLLKGKTAEIKMILPFLFFIMFLLISCVKSSGEKKLTWKVFLIRYRIYRKQSCNCGCSSASGN